ncbi:centromere protein C isoform 1-T1 [Anomaloglossus baeobatrachus]|uniref:centromere protein C isoform X1 n=1 Tax=Anomaloglossus baeobatrachus TaxID=238106 RepID=UPI003F4FDC00
MSDDWSLSHLKQSYRPRYFGNRAEDVPDFQPGENAMSFLNKYFNMSSTTSNSDFDSIVSRSSLSLHVTSLQSREKTAQNALTSRVNYTPGQSKADVHLKTKADPVINPSLSEMNQNPEFSDEESDGDHDMVAKLIEKSFPENNNLSGNSKKCTEKLYSSDTSVLKEQPRPTSNIHAKKCLSFIDVSAAARKDTYMDKVLRNSNNAEQLEPKKQEVLTLNHETPDRTPTISGVKPKYTFVMEEDRGSSSSGWVSPFKNKLVSRFSTPVEVKKAPTPSKASGIKTTRIQQETSKNKKSVERFKYTFVMEEDRGSSSSGWVSPFKKKLVSRFSTPVEVKKTPTPSKASGIKTTGIQQETSKNKKSAERIVNSERIAKDRNSRRTGFLEDFFQSSALGFVGNSSSVGYKPPSTSSPEITGEEFIVEGISSKIEPFRIPVPVKAKTKQNDFVSKGEKTVLQMANSESEGTVKKCSIKKTPKSPKKASKLPEQEDALQRIGEWVEPGPVTTDMGVQQVVEQFEKPLASQDVDLPLDVEEIENSPEDDIFLAENQKDIDSRQSEKTIMNPASKQKQQTRRSLRQKSNRRTVSVFENLGTKFNIKYRKGKGKGKSIKAAKKAKKSKLSQGKLEEKVKGKKTKNNVAGKKNLCSQSESGTLEVADCSSQSSETDDRLQLRKRKVKIKHSNTPCPADDHNEESVFQSGPVLRERTRRFTAALRPIACHLESLDFEDQDKQDSTVVDSDAAVLSSVSEGPEHHIISAEDDESIVYSKHKEFFPRYSLAFDPDTESDVLVDCISHGEKGTFLGDDACRSWNSFNNNVFNTGKLIIAPKKFTERHISMSIMIYYIEQGHVQLNLHKSERILKAGDFFFVPPGNSSTITNLEDKEAVLVFNKLNRFT